MSEVQLTKREWGIVILLANESLSLAEIAGRIHTSPSTIKSHLRSIYRKTGLSGDKRICPRIAVMHVLGVRRPVQGDTEVALRAGLTKREWAVLEAVWQGMSNLRMSAEMGIPEQSFKNLLNAIFDKIGCWNRMEVAAWYEAHREAEGAGCVQ